MSVRDALIKEMSKSGGRVRVVKVPDNRRPTAESLKKLEQEISAQMDTNRAMRERSVICAEKCF